MRLSAVRLFRLGHYKGPHPNAVSVLDFPEPKAVSPFIRFCRWSLLTLGVTWGVWRNNRIQRWHKGAREVDFEEHTHHYETEKRVAFVKGREDLIVLLKQAGIPLDYENRKSFHILDLPYSGKQEQKKE